MNFIYPYLCNCSLIGDHGDLRFSFPMSLSREPDRQRFNNAPET